LRKKPSDFPARKVHKRRVSSFCCVVIKTLRRLRENFAEIKSTTDLKKKMETVVELAHPLVSRQLCIVGQCITNQ
jgi:hypothetical protein